MKALNNVRMLKKVAIAAGAAALLLFGGSIVVAALKPAAAGASLASQMMPTISGFVGAVVSALFFGKLKEWEKNFLVGAPGVPRIRPSSLCPTAELSRAPVCVEFAILRSSFALLCVTTVSLGRLQGRTRRRATTFPGRRTRGNS